MALTLNAEQKFIIDIFSGKDMYMIPHYQRAYSWTTEECSDLLEDLFKAYTVNQEEGYFLGNIVIARNSKEKNFLEVIDGQQRLITLTLLIRILSILLPENTDLVNALKIPSKTRGGEPKQRLRTKVFEQRDAIFLKEVLNGDLSALCPVPKKINNNFLKNICFIKKSIENFINDNSLDELANFSDFLMESTSLLPIETNDEDEEKARHKALKIFETINNRGKELSSSDIFKARLYSMALNVKDTETFISQWDRFTQECEDFNDKDYSVDRIFKIYSYIIRAHTNISKSEIGLMSFFNTDFFKDKNYLDIMHDLLNITASVQFYKKCIVNDLNQSLMKWFQLISEYTNNFPKDALILYIFKNKSFDSTTHDSLISFTRNLVKKAYFKGSTTYIKNDIYKLMIEIMKVKQYDYIFIKKGIQDDTFDFSGRLYKGFGLLSIYLDENISPCYPYYIKRLRDLTPYQYINYSYFDQIGHTVVLNSEKVVIETTNLKKLDKNSYDKREESFRQTLLDFFKSTY